jgi:hypothetical protein
VPLKDCPPGLFRFDGCIGFKSEYGGGEPYVVKTGEIFWGGTNSPRDRNRLAVSPIPYAALATVAATNTTPAAKVERWRIMPREGGEMWMERWGSGEWVEYEKIKHLLSPVASAREEAGGESGKTSPVLTGDKLALPGGDAERREDSRIETRKHIGMVQGLMGRVIADLAQRQQVHDQSKLVSPEVEVFDAMTPKLAASTYGSEEYRGFLAQMKPALDHHYAHNSHHPEHFRWWCGLCERRFTDAQWEVAPQGPNDSGLRYCPVCCREGMIYEAYLEVQTGKGLHGMSLLDVLEMLCDWKAATLRHNDGDIRKSISLNQKRFGYSDELKQILLNTLPAVDALAQPTPAPSQDAEPPITSKES